jgi:hypothetical protein
MTPTSEFWNVITALASMATAIIAAFVIIEARAIRQTEWLLRQNQAWNDLCHVVTQKDDQSSIPALLLGESVASPLQPRDAFLLMSYFNVVSSEYNAYRARAIKRRYVIHSFGMTARIVAANKAWIFQFLEENGYDLDFRRAVAIVTVIGDDLEKRDYSLRRELLASSQFGRFCGPGYRRWLRRELDNEQIDTLCPPADRVDRDRQATMSSSLRAAS